MNWLKTGTVSLALLACYLLVTAVPGVQTAAAQERPNIVFILSDDHRYDFMGFMEEPGTPSFLETPAMDKMAGEGVHIANAFVTTSLCSPSRASILTGQYAHTHGVVDNQRLVPEGTRFFPQDLQEEGYETAFVGKWHMGRSSDEPRKGFDHWESYPGQGVYFDPTFNVNGTRQQFEGHVTDITTDRALRWLEEDREDPFFLYVSHKAPHYPFEPPKRYDGLYGDEPIDYPETMANTEENYDSQPHWVRERRYGIHGIDHMITGNLDNDPVPDFDTLYHDFAESVAAIDENVGRVLDYLETNDMAENTVVVYMGDNGFHLGEHGFYDKRDAFEESIRVPMLAWAPGRIEPGQRIEEMVANIDIAPTILDLVGRSVPDEMQGESFWPLLQGEDIAWRDEILYEYYWEWNFPATPSVFALRGERYKYAFYHGAWDKNSFHDLETDPHERHNLIDVPAFQDKILEMRERLFEKLEETDGMQIPLRTPAGEQFYDRKLKN
jgi:N-acetylglucosamine-6-sulfatase